MDIKKFFNSYAYNPSRVEQKGKLISTIIESSKYEVVPSIDEYVQALSSAKSKLVQSRTLIYDHYTTVLMIDNVVTSLLSKRFSNIKNKTIGMKVNGELIEEKLFHTSPKFDAFLIDILRTKLWGFNVFEFDNKEDDFNYYLFPHKHINPYRKEVLKAQYDSEGVSFKDKSDIMFLGDADDLGLLAQITLLSIYRRYGMFNYSRYAELAAENFTTIKTRGFTTDDNLQKVNEQYASRTNGIMQVPEGVDVMTESNTSSQQNTLFEGYLKNLKEELAILILGQTMTTFDGSSRSQAEVHLGEQKSLFADDESYILNALNFNFKDYLHIWSEIDKNKVEFVFLPNSELEIQSKLDRYTKLKDLGLVFTDAELRDTFKELL